MRANVKLILNTSIKVKSKVLAFPLLLILFMYSHILAIIKQCYNSIVITYNFSYRIKFFFFVTSVKQFVYTHTHYFRRPHLLSSIATTAAHNRHQSNEDVQRVHVDGHCIVDRIVRLDAIVGIRFGFAHNALRVVQQETAKQ